LFGRRTYDDLLTTWNARGGMFKDALNAAQKYVVSQTLADPLPSPVMMTASSTASLLRSMEAG
jgi:hypothetical protein